MNLTGTALAGPCSEITPCRRAVLVALHHGLPQVGLAPVSFRKIEAMLGIPKSTCCNIYKPALKNATHRHLQVPPTATPNPELPQAIQHPELPPTVQHLELQQATQHPKLPRTAQHPELPPTAQHLELQQATQHPEWEEFLSEIDTQLDTLYNVEEEISPGLPTISGSIEEEVVQVNRPDSEWEGFLSEIDAELDILYDTGCDTSSEKDLAWVGTEAEEPHWQTEIELLDLISTEYLNSDAWSGRPQVLSGLEKDHLVAVAKRDWGTRHMTWEEVQLEANLGHVGRSTILRTLHSRGVKAYVEECKFILDEDNKK